jgi:hypothetical protein
MASTRQLRSSKRRTRHAQPSSSTTTTIESQSANTRGLSCLADEIYLEILSHLPAFPIPTEHRETDNELYGHRRRVLDALSQTCRTLRRVFLRYRWQRIEVYDGMDLGRGPRRGMGYEKRLGKVYAVARELIRQLETVTVRNASLAQFVRCVNPDSKKKLGCSSCPILKMIYIFVIAYLTFASLIILPRLCFPNWHDVSPCFRICIPSISILILASANLLQTASLPTHILTFALHVSRGVEPPSCILVQD